MSTFNTASGWILAGGIVALGSSIVMDEVFHSERPEEMAYVVEGVVEEGEGGEAETPIAVALQNATAADGEAVFRRCATCHTINQGGANGTGPNLYGIMGKGVASIGGFNYSDALTSVGGTWGWENMSAWLASPRNFANGTTMSFAGLSSVEDRAALLLYLNEQGSNLPLPEPPAEAAPAEGDAEATEAEDAAIEGEEAADPEAEAATEAPVAEPAE